MKHFFALLLSVALPLAAVAGAARGGEPAGGDPRAAKPMIAAHCVKCHVVPGFPDDRVQPAVQAPSFAEIAADPARYPDAALRAFLRKPHYPMQGFVLSRSDIENVIAFLHSLRKK